MFALFPRHARRTLSACAALPAQCAACRTADNEAPVVGLGLGWRPRLAPDALREEGVAALALEHVHLLAGRVAHGDRAGVHAHEQAHVEVDAQTQHLRG
jgi:hypothetical protein